MRRPGPIYQGYYVYFTDSQNRSEQIMNNRSQNHVSPKTRAGNTTMIKPLLITILISFSATVYAVDPVSTGYWDDTAIGGHDAVAYHSPEVIDVHREIKGQKQYAVEWNNATWLFASQASADKFKSNPEKYVPQYNGFCSNALALDEGLIRTDGTVWEFFDDKLHMFFAERGRQRWLNGDWKRYRAEADEAWEQLRKQ